MCYYVPMRCTNSSAKQVALTHTYLKVTTMSNAKQTRAARIALAGKLARAKLHAHNVAQSQQLTVAANKQAYLLAVQQLAAQYGLPAPTQAQRPVRNTQQHSASTVPSACKAVHAICAANPGAARKFVIDLCVKQGINPATAATQFGIYQKQQKAATQTVQ